MRSFVIAGFLCLGGNAFGAKKTVVHVGDTCVLKKKLTASAGKKSITVPLGRSVKVTAVEKSNVVFTSAGKEARSSRKALEDVCRVTSPAPVKPEAPAAPASLLADDAELPLAAPALVAPAAAPPVVEKPSEPESVGADVSASANRTAPPPDHRMQTAGWALTGIGLAGMVGGGAFFTVADLQAAALNKHAVAYNAAPLRATTEFNSINRGRGAVSTFDLVAYVSGGVGIAALATGVVLLLASRPSERGQAEVDLIPSLGGASLLALF